MPAELDLDDIYAGDRYDLLLCAMVPGTERVLHVLDAHGNGNVVLTDGDATIQCPTAAFVAGDVGKVIAGGGIPPAATILSVTSPTEAEMSAPATESTLIGAAFVGTPKNLTGKTFRAQTRTSPGATTAVPFTIDQTSYVASGQIVLSLAKTVTQTLESGVWDCECIEDEETWWAGLTAVDRDVSRP